MTSDHYILTHDSTQTIINKTIDADSNTISNIAGTNFKSQDIADAGKVWGIDEAGKTILMPQDGYKYTHYVNMDCVDASGNPYRITFTAVAAVENAFTSTTLLKYMYESELNGSTASGYFLPVYGVEYDSGSVTMVLGISSPDETTMNALIIREGFKSVETGLTVSTIIDKCVAF